MRIDGTNDAAEKYYFKAKKYFSGLNDKVYRAYELLQGGRISEAQRLLLPVSDTVELNALLACLIAKKTAFSEILTRVDKMNVQKDCYTHRLLAIAALQSEEYRAGLEYIHKAAPAGTINPDNSVIESLLHFWSAMGETYPDTNRLGFVFASNRRFYPTIRQQEELEAAYDILMPANDLGAEGISELQKQTILWGLVAISDLIPGKDSQYWLNRFKDALPNHPFTILYSISKGISLAEKDRNDFLNRPTQGQSGIYAYAKLQLLLSLKKYDEAKAYFEEHKDSIAHYKSSSVAEEELEMLFACHDYSAAKEILGQVDMQSEVKERYALGIQFNLSGKARKELIRSAIEFAKKTGQPIDYYNAGVMCSKFSKWKDAIANARLWWAKTREQIALEFLAEAYYNKGDNKKCLKTIDKAKCNGTLWEGIIKFEINSLAAMAKYNEARVQSQTLGYTVTDPRYSVWLARTYIAEGNSKMAIRALRDCADSGRCDIGVYELLIQQLQGEEPDLAYHYAKQLHFNFPNDPRVTNFVGRVALMTGHESEDISSAFFRQLQDEAKTNSGTRLVTLDEAVKIIKETNEWQREIEAKYKKIEIPIHALITSGNQCLGALACSIYDDKNLLYYGRYGMAKEISISKKTPLVIDYTACLTLCRFGLFQKVCDYFDHVWLDSHIFELWLEEINRLTNVQHNVVNQEIALSELLKRLKFNPYSDDKPVPGDLPYCPSDYYTIEHAKATGALLVGCKAVGKFHGKDIPADWKDYFIDPKDFYAALERLGLRHPPFDAKSVNVGLSARILPGCNLILDQMVMVELLNNNALEAVFEYFKIWISENKAESINIRAKAHRKQKALAEWLNEALMKVRDCYDNGSAILQTFSTEKLKGTMEPPLQLLVEELNAASRSPFCLVVDDRWCSSYYKIKTKDSSSYIFTTYDIICLLHSEKALSNPEFYDLIDRLICDKYCFFVPPAEYLMSRLYLTSVSDAGPLNETDILGALRRLISFSIESEAGLSDVAANASLLSEVGGFLTELHQELKRCLSFVWDSDKETEWKEAV